MKKTKKGWLFDVGDYTIQLYRDYFINHEIRPVINQPFFVNGDQSTARDPGYMHVCATQNFVPHHFALPSLYSLRMVRSMPGAIQKHGSQETAEILLNFFESGVRRNVLAPFLLVKYLKLDGNVGIVFARSFLEYWF